MTFLLFFPSFLIPLFLQFLLLLGGSCAIDGYDEAPLCSSFASGLFDIDVIFHVHCTKPVWCVTSRHAANPSQDHLNKALYICCYLIGTSTYSLVYNGGSGAGLIACMDSDWGSDPTSC